MRSIYRIIIICIAVFSSGIVSAQTNDTTATFMVDGVCGQCKQRIQKALKIKGIKTASWESSTKMLTVSYDPSVITLPAIHKKVAAVGHDTEIEKADDAVYQALDECCHYREITTHDDMEEEHETDTLNKIRGIVYENRDGDTHPLAGATIKLVGSNVSVITNPHGEFILPAAGEKLVISYAGFNTDTVAVNGMSNMEITLEKKEDLNTVIVSTRRRTSYIDHNSPFRINVISKKELLKAACCNLSESFETNPSVDVSYNDAVTGSKQIQLLGLAGIYTQLTVENLPGPRGIATPLGLNSIAGPWVESIQLIKGSGSVVNGFESIAGQINVELQKPREADRLYLNGYVNNMGKTDFNLNFSHRLNEKWSTGFLLHDDFLYNKVDFNNDGFRDLPTGNQFSGVHRWQYLGDKGLMAQFGVKAMFDEKTGGQTEFDPSKHKLTTQHYGLGIDSRRLEAFGKIGYVFPEKMYRSFGFEVSAFDHEQDSYFGLKSYDARQKNFYSNLIYQSQLGSEAHQLRTGLSFQHDEYNENVTGSVYKRTESVPGAFAEYTFKLEGKLDIVAGLRTDHNSLYGWFVTPRLNVRYEPVNGTTIRLSAGRGQRTANIFAENMGAFVSSREIMLMNNGNTNGAYGLSPEVAWNKGISVDQRFKLFGEDASMGVDFYRNDFENQVVVDVEDAQYIMFYNLEGKSFSNSLQAEMNFTPVKKFDVKLAYRYFDVKTRFGNELLQKPLTAKNRAFANLAYDLNGWKFDYTVNYVGSKRIPSTKNNPLAYQLDEKSPSYVTMNAQISKALGKKKAWDLYIGGENLSNYFQENAIISASEPFGNYFDASMIWGPVSGRNIYAGFRFKVK